MSKEITIIVAAHKESPMPKDEMYLPLHVGAAGRFNKDGTPFDLGYTRDDTGENISELNPSFGTQTGLYWMWKNLDSDYKGLVHYRRYFTGSKKDHNDLVGSAITYAQIKPMLREYSVFVPKKRRYYIETLSSHYAHTHDAEHLKLCRKIIEEKSPEYINAYDNVLKRRWGYMFNMMILRKDLMEDYCSWLFVILFELYEKVDKTGMSAFERRFCGRISEILFDVWIEYKIQKEELKTTDIKELGYIEDVVWGPKMKNFLAAKFLKRNYSRSAAAKAPKHRMGGGNI